MTWQRHMYLNGECFFTVLNFIVYCFDGDTIMKIPPPYDLNTADKLKTLINQHIYMYA